MRPLSPPPRFSASYTVKQTACKVDDMETLGQSLCETYKQFDSLKIELHPQYVANRYTNDQWPVFSDTPHFDVPVYPGTIKHAVCVYATYKEKPAADAVPSDTPQEEKHLDLGGWSTYDLRGNYASKIREDIANAIRDLARQNIKIQ